MATIRYGDMRFNTDTDQQVNVYRDLITEMLREGKPGWLPIGGTSDDGTDGIAWLLISPGVPMAITTSGSPDAAGQALLDLTEDVLGGPVGGDVSDHEDSPG